MYNRIQILPKIHGKVYWFVIISLYQESTTSDRTVITCFCTFFVNWNLYKNDKNVQRLCIINLWLHNFTCYIMKRKLKQLWSTIPPILTKRTITSHLNSQNPENTMTYEVGNPGPGLGQEHK